MAERDTLPPITKKAVQRPLNASREFALTDEDVEIVADAALGPEPAEPTEDGDEALRLPSDMSPSAVHKQYIRDRLRAARLASVPSVKEILSDRRKRHFLVALAETGILSHACARAGWTPSTARSLRSADKDFAERWDEALEFAADAAEAEAFRRGVHGYEKDVYHKGEKVGKEVIYSDRMLELTLKARRPDRFRDSHKIDANVSGGVLVVPQAPSEGDWEKASTAGQAQYREAPDD